MIRHWLFLAGIALATSASGREVVLEMPNHQAARAEYLAGAADKPAVLILHGFLQTHDFHTVHSMAEGLGDAGYSVLAPTLTLGVPYRSQSLDCEAIHTHSLQGDEAEIGAWLGWLEAKRHGPIILVGHSTGSMELLAYLSHHHDPRIAKLIGASIIEATLDGGEPARTRLAADLERRIKARDNSPVIHQFSYCGRYTSTPASLLSYLQWSPERILEAARAVQVPATFIMGGSDDRLPAGWVEQLKQTGKKVRIIKGAGHFLDGEHEFDLQDVLSEEARL
jgi:pimeloyl-ACP methyl ester carboxylesterase